jgi:hypothetical protein
MIFSASHRQYGHDFKSRVLNLSPRCYFEMNEASGSTLVNRGSLGPAFNATITGTPTYQASPLLRNKDSAMTFDGATSYAATATSASIGVDTSPNTIGCWAKWTSTATTLGVMTLRGTGGINGDAPLVVLVNWPSVGNISVAMFNNTATVTASAMAYNDGNPHMIIAGTNAAVTHCSLWVDGALIGTGAGGGVGVTNDLRLGIGANVFSSANLFFPGTIDDPFHIPLYVMTDAKALALYNAGIR